MVGILKGLSRFVFSGMGFLCMSFLLVAAMDECSDPDTAGSSLFVQAIGNRYEPISEGPVTIATPQTPFDGLFPPERGFGPAPMVRTGVSARDAGVPDGNYQLRLLRQADCSMTKYLTGNDTSTGGFTVYSVPNVQTYLHAAAQLTTTPNQFKNGCNDTMIGKSSAMEGYAGLTKSGQMIAFQVTENNDLEESVIDLSQSTTTHAGTSTYTGFGSTIKYAGSMVVADLNGDGNQDVVVSADPYNGGSSGLAILLGNGDGTFAAPVFYATAAAPGFFTVDDLNGDGKLDVVIGEESGSVSTTEFFAGKGDGTFAAAKTAFAGYSGQMATGDIDGDGVRDIVVGLGVVMKGNGDGTFTTGPRVGPTYAGQGTPVVGDFNNDGKLDVMYLHGEAGVYTFLGHGDGTFTQGPSYTAIYGSEEMSALDIDGDGNLDLVVGAGNSGALGGSDNTGGIWEVLMGNGDGTFQGSRLYPAVSHDEIPNAFVFGDFNGNGSLDMLTTANGTGLQVLANNGKGAFTAGPINKSTHPLKLAAAFMDGDKKLDAVFLDYNSVSSVTSVGVALGNGDGTFQLPREYALPDQNGAQSVVTGDFNGDGFPDVVATTPTAVYLYLNDGTGGLVAPVVVDTVEMNSATFGPSSAASVGDLNGDGKLDLVVTNDLVGKVKVFLGNGNGTFAAATVYQPDTNSMTSADQVAVVDLNGDGKLDLVFSTVENFTLNPILNVYLGKGDGTFGALMTTVLPQNANGIAVADLNGDGTPDVLLGSCCGAAYAMAVPGKGDGTFEPVYEFPNGLSVANVGAADLNGDGQADIVMGPIEGGADGGIVVSLNLHGKAVTPVTPVATTTTLKAAPNPAMVGQSVTFTAIVTENGGSSVPSDTVTFLDGQTTLGSGTLTAGTASFSTSGLSAGSHSITASYGGDTGDATSVSAALTEVVNVPVVGTSTTLSAAPNPAPAGQSVTFTAKVAPTSGTGVPTGTVTFSEETKTLGMGTVSAGSATFATTSLSVGTHNVVAMYGGDAGDSSSVSAPVSEVIDAAAPTLVATTTVLSTSSSSASAGTSIKLTAKVSDPAGTSVPTGTVTFLDGTAPLGSGILTAGTATFATTGLAVGSHTLTASYGGDTENASSVSAGVGVTITAAGTPSFSIALNPASGTVGQSGMVSTTLTIRSKGGFNQPVSFACGNLPNHSICSFSPSVATPSGGAVTTTMTIETGVATASVSLPEWAPGARSLEWTAFAGIIGLGLSGVRRKVRRRLAAVIVLGLLGLAFTGCAKGTPNNFTAPGGSAVTVTATSGTISQTVTYMLKVE